MPHDDHEKNRIAWNEMATVHFRHPGYRVKEFLAGESTLHPIELNELGDVEGKSLLHLFCQFGLDTLSWARMGATVTGVDISDQSIEYANQLVKQSGIAGRFLRSDVMDLIGKIDDKFDIVFQSYGTHCWIEDLNQWARVAAHYLKPQGVFYIVDFHPITMLFEDEVTSYFEKGPYRYRNEADYCDKKYFVKNERVEWQHKMSDIIGVLIRSGLTIESFKEYDMNVDPLKDDWVKKGGYYYPPEGPSRYPLMFSIRARKLTE